MNGSVLITGGLGNLGSWLTKEFCRYGYDVYVLTRQAKYKIEDIEYKVIEVDITDIEALKKALKIPFDYCIHTASFNEFFLNDYPKKALEINALGTRNILEVLSGTGLKKFIYFSTFHVYGVTDGIVTEESALVPKNDYASTHLFAEFYVKQFNANYKIDYIIFRLSNSYGCPLNLNTDKWYLVLNDLARSAYEKGKIEIKGNGEAKRDFIWMGDVASITIKALNSTQSGIYNMSSMQSHKIIELANIVKTEFEARYNKPISIEINKNDKNVYPNLIVDNSKLSSSIDDFICHNALSNEVKKIFTLLEDS